MEEKKSGSWYLGILVLLLLQVFSGAMCKVPTALAADKLRLAITDLEGLEQLQREFGAFREVLNEKTGLNIEFFPVSSRTAAVEAMRSGKVELVLTGPAEYVVFQSRIKTVPVVGFSRPDYYGEIIVLAESGIRSISDLKGKKIAMGDVGSTSKHLAPMQLLKDNGIDPLKDLEVVHTSVKLGWEALKRGDVAAFATTDDKFKSLRAKETEMEPGAFKVIGRGPDLPNDILLARADLDSAVVAKLKEAFTKYQKELIAAIIKGDDNQKYKGMKFIPTVHDRDYEYVRAMYRTCGYPQFTAFIGE